MWQKIHRGTSRLSHFDIQPSKLSYNHFHTKLGLMRNSFEHSYFGAIKIIDVMLILKRPGQTILKAPVAHYMRLDGQRIYNAILLRRDPAVTVAVE
jgi:hypothetical protein